MIHADIEALLGAYALDATDGTETAAVEQHLAYCPRCRAEVVAHHEVAGLIGNLGGEAPEHLWDSIAARLGSGPGVPPASPLASGPDVPRRQLRLPILAGLAAAVVAVVGLLGVSSIRLQHRVDALEARARNGALQQAVAAALLDPSHSTARLVSADGRLDLEIVALPRGDAYVAAADLPALDHGHTYQLWGLVRGRTVSLGLLGSQPRLAVFRIDPAVSRLMVTAEPLGGVPVPDSKIVVQGAISV